MQGARILNGPILSSARCAYLLCRELPQWSWVVILVLKKGQDHGKDDLKHQREPV